MDVGDTFIAAGHLWIVVLKTNPIGSVVVFEIQTYRPGTPGSDSTCVLNNGEHPFIKHKTEVCYFRGEILSPPEQKVAMGKLTAHEPASRELVSKIAHMALQSDQTPGKICLVIQESENK